MQHVDKKARIEEDEFRAKFPEALILPTLDCKRITSLAFSPNGNRLASSTADCMYLWDTRTGALLKKAKKGGLRGIVSSAFCGHGTAVVVGIPKEGIFVWDLISNEINDASDDVSITVPSGATLGAFHLRARGSILRAPANEAGLPLPAMRDAIAKHGDRSDEKNTPWDVSDDKRLFVWQTKSNDVVVWDLPRRRCVNILSGQTSQSRTLGISPDGTFVISRGDEGTVRIWTCADAVCHYAFRPNAISVAAVMISPDSKSIATSLGDGSIGIIRPDWFNADIEFADMKSAAKTK